MKRPERIKFLGKTVTIEWAEKVVSDDGEEVNGYSDPDGQRVFIQTGLPLETEQDKVLHELMHHVEAAMNLDLEENVITLMATGMLAIIKDNPSLVTYLRRKPEGNK